MLKSESLNFKGPINLLLSFTFDGTCAFEFHILIGHNLMSLTAISQIPSSLARNARESEIYETLRMSKFYSSSLTIPCLGGNQITESQDLSNLLRRVIH